MNHIEVMKQALEALEYHTEQTRPLFKTEHAIVALKEAIAEAGHGIKQDTDPCAGCPKGAVCKTPTCGRLKLPVDHVLRTGYSK